MSDHLPEHLPECDHYTQTRQWSVPCICDWLRAAEQRVTAKWAQTRARNQRVQELIAEAFDNGCRSTEKNYTKGYAAALDKARDELEALPNHVRSWANGDVFHAEPTVDLIRALAAIDALRTNP